MKHKCNGILYQFLINKEEYKKIQESVVRKNNFKFFISSIVYFLY